MANSTALGIWRPTIQGTQRPILRRRLTQVWRSKRCKPFVWYRHVDVTGCHRITLVEWQTWVRRVGAVLETPKGG